MKSRDVASLYNQIPVGALVQIVPDKLPEVPKGHHVITTSAANFAVPRVANNGREGEETASLLHLNLR
jgi:hypothetical protein